MPTLTKESYDRLKQFIKRRPSKDALCIRCGKAGWRYLGTGRSIWIAGFTGGFGEVRNVGELYCKYCDPEPKPPVYGHPIQEDDIVELL